MHLHTRDRRTTYSEGVAPVIFGHVSDDLCGSTVFGVRKEPELSQVEQHLLICEIRRARLTEFDDTWGPARLRVRGIGFRRSQGRPSHRASAASETLE